MRSKLLKLFQQCEHLSGLILKFVPENKTNRDHLKLQRNIRLTIINYLKEHSFTLSQLPCLDVYLTLKAERQLLTRIEEEELTRVQKELVNRQQINSQKILQQNTGFTDRVNNANYKVFYK